MQRGGASGGHSYVVVSHARSEGLEESHLAADARGGSELGQLPENVNGADTDLGHGMSAAWWTPADESSVKKREMERGSQRQRWGPQ